MSSSHELFEMSRRVMESEDYPSVRLKEDTHLHQRPHHYYQNTSYVISEDGDRIQTENDRGANIREDNVTMPMNGGDWGRQMVTMAVVNNKEAKTRLFLGKKTKS